MSSECSTPVFTLFMSMFLTLKIVNEYYLGVVPLRLGVIYLPSASIA